MLLPSRDGTTPAGIASGVKRFVERARRPIVLYLKHDGMIDAATIKRMVDDGLISWIKYGIVRENPSSDPYLSSIVDAVGPSLIVSGMGEQPVIVHLRDFKLAGFTSGCVCIAPRLSMKMLKAVKAGDFAAADSIRQQFAPLEKLRDAINPVRALHAAVALAGIAETGPITPFWSPINDNDSESIQTAAKQLLSLNQG
jgi:dihydrodipicolinate synthase/N-acetylneuraminate lyase